MIPWAYISLICLGGDQNKTMKYKFKYVSKYVCLIYRLPNYFDQRLFTLKFAGNLHTLRALQDASWLVSCWVCGLDSWLESQQLPFRWESNKLIKLIHMATHLLSCSHSHYLTVLRLNHWTDMDYFMDVFTIFLGLEQISWTDFLTKILISVLKMNESLTGLEWHDYV